MKYNKDLIKNSLTIEQVYDLCAELGAEPEIKNDIIVMQTICHNHPGQGSRKLYYYDNTKLFKCFTECNDTFDIFSLVMKASRSTGQNFNLYQSIAFVAQYYGFDAIAEEAYKEQLEDWNILAKKVKKDPHPNQIVELKHYDENILKHLPQPHIKPWEKEGIKYNIIKDRGIRFDPVNNGIVIPHYDINNNLIGIRERTLIKDNEKYGKYRPAILNKKMYNHPLGFNLYNINNSKDNIKAVGKAIVGEGEKFCLGYASYFGKENDISVACCGSSLITYQVNLLLSLQVKEIIVAFDKQFQKVGDIEWQKWTKKLADIYNKYSGFVLISFMFDTKNLLGYKESPIDGGKDIFLRMFAERVTLF